MKQIQDAFQEFTTRDETAIVLISQYIPNMIRFLVDNYNNKQVPSILEIPSKDHLYDVAHGSVLSKVKFIKDRISDIWEMLEIVEVCVCVCVRARVLRLFHDKPVATVLYFTSAETAYPEG
ncbi:v-type proton ATPase subunit f [Phtheirospermum japonicum]|uniref:V-type proton ATPase subunit f n=1 Tax=Phtheirospermum japonicum TaxID=374723 RepID=A0A830CFV4_9LAMI|nr:v-type proton ATPase subunit f [Phtheirospermum japonicum]